MPRAGEKSEAHWGVSSPYTSTYSLILTYGPPLLMYLVNLQVAFQHTLLAAFGTSNDVPTPHTRTPIPLSINVLNTKFYRRTEIGDITYI